MLLVFKTYYLINITFKKKKKKNYSYFTGTECHLMSLYTVLFIVPCKCIYLYIHSLILMKTFMHGCIVHTHYFFILKNKSHIKGVKKLL